jgi:hypothetical protein
MDNCMGSCYTVLRKLSYLKLVANFNLYLIQVSQLPFMRLTPRTCCPSPYD